MDEAWLTENLTSQLKCDALPTALNTLVEAVLLLEEAEEDYEMIFSTIETHLNMLRAYMEADECKFTERLNEFYFVALCCPYAVPRVYLLIIATEVLLRLGGHNCQKYLPNLLQHLYCVQNPTGGILARKFAAAVVWKSYLKNNLHKETIREFYLQNFFCCVRLLTRMEFLSSPMETGLAKRLNYSYVADTMFHRILECTETVDEYLTAILPRVLSFAYNLTNASNISYVYTFLGSRVSSEFAVFSVDKLFGGMVAQNAPSHVFDFLTRNVLKYNVTDFKEGVTAYREGRTSFNYEAELERIARYISDELAVIPEYVVAFASGKAELHPVLISAGFCIRLLEFLVGFGFNILETTKTVLHWVMSELDSLDIDVISPTDYPNEAEDVRIIWSRLRNETYYEIVYESLANICTEAIKYYGLSGHDVVDLVNGIFNYIKSTVAENVILCGILRGIIASNDNENIEQILNTVISKARTQDHAELLGKLVVNYRKSSVQLRLQNYGYFRVCADVCSKSGLDPTLLLKNLIGESIEVIETRGIAPISPSTRREEYRANATFEEPAASELAYASDRSADGNNDGNDTAHVSSANDTESTLQIDFDASEATQNGTSNDSGIVIDDAIFSSEPSCSIASAQTNISSPVSNLPGETGMSSEAVLKFVNLAHNCLQQLEKYDHSSTVQLYLSLAVAVDSHCLASQTISFLSTAMSLVEKYILNTADEYEYLTYFFEHLMMKLTNVPPDTQEAFYSRLVKHSRGLLNEDEKATSFLRCAVAFKLLDNEEESRNCVELCMSTIDNGMLITEVTLGKCYTAIIDNGLYNPPNLEEIFQSCRRKMHQLNEFQSTAASPLIDLASAAEAYM